MSSSNTLPTPPEGPPYPPATAGFGGEPSVIPDIPILSVFTFLYLSFAIINFGIFIYNKRKGHFFPPSAALGGFCMARILTCTLRIGWATRHDNISLSIAAQIFVNIGTLILYVINIVLAERILRARQPRLGWAVIIKVYTITLYTLVGAALCLMITMIVMSFYTLNIPTLTDAKWIEAGAILYILILALTPFNLLFLAYAIPASEKAEPFGRGSVNSKALVLIVGAGCCVLIAGFKVGVFWAPSRPVSDPHWFDSKASFYCFLFMLEILVLITYLVGRIDQRFHVPDGHEKRKTYLDPKQRQRQWVREDSESEDFKEDRPSGESWLELEKMDSGLGIPHFEY